MPLRSALFAIILAPVLILCLPASTRAAAPYCGSPEPATITVEPVFEEIQYEFYQPMMRIRDMADSGSHGHQAEQWPVGLATGEMFVRMGSEIQSRHAANDGSTCGSLKSLTIKLGFTENKIYVAREFPRRSCPHKTVLMHEERHKAVDRALLEEYAEKARYFFTQLASDIGVMAHPSGAMLEAEINGRLNDEMKKFTDAMDQERKRRQTAVDTQEEYQRVSASCNGQLMEVVNQRLDLIRSSDPSFAARVGGTAPPADK